MQQSPLLSSRKLPPEVKAAVESLLGRALKDNESISVRTYEAHEAPAGQAQQIALEALKRHFAQIDEQLRDVPKDELEETIEEALRSVRATRRPGQ